MCALAIAGQAIANSPRQIDVPAGELTLALQQLAQQTGVEFVYSAEEIKGVHTQGAHGKLTAKEAVSKLLEGTTLQLTVHSSGAFLISYPHTSSLSTPAGYAAGGPLVEDVLGIRACACYRGDGGWSIAMTNQPEIRTYLLIGRTARRIAVIPSWIALVCICRPELSIPAILRRTAGRGDTGVSSSVLYVDRYDAASPFFCDNSKTLREIL
jgi:hypothetical protein